MHTWVSIFPRGSRSWSQRSMILMRIKTY